jgi:hypothetical protein
MGKEMRILSIRPCGTSRVLLHAVKSYDMGPSRFTSHPRGRTFGSSGKHTNHYTTKATQWERRYSSYSFLTSELDGVSGQRHAPAELCPGKGSPGTHWIGGWVGPRVGLDTEARGKILCLCGESNPGSKVCSQKLYWSLSVNLKKCIVSLPNE